MTGRLAIVGLGPGDPRWLTPAAAEALQAATDLVGYGPYLDRIPERPGQRRHASDNRVELDRARHALRLAAEGRQVAVVSGGDPGVFAMAAAVFEALEGGNPEWARLPITVEPGVTAMLAAAARAGAPLGGDFCALSLSDNLKPWDLIERRLTAALEADFVVALYNPISKARPWQLGEALRMAAERRAAATPVIFARAVGRPDERVTVVPLGEARPEAADMATLVVIGSSLTRRAAHEAGFVYTPRRAAFDPERISNPPPHPEAPRSGLEGPPGAERVLEPSFEARPRLAPQDEVRGWDESSCSESSSQDEGEDAEERP